MHFYKHQNYKKILGLALALYLVFGGWNTLTETVVYAQNISPPSENIFSSTASLAIMLATAMETIAFMIFNFLQFFLDPLFILDVTLAEGLRNLWKYSRDIMNVIFAFLLIFAGIYTVVMGNKEFVEQKYKKFILAVILVNFSWFFPRVILDAANVLTATIYQLPAGLNPSGQVECVLPKKNPEDDQEAVKECTVITNIRYFKGCDPPPDNTYDTSLGIVCFKREPWSKNTNTAYGMLNGLVINYAQLPELTRVLNTSTGGGAQGNANERFKEYLLFLIHVIFILVLMTMLFLPLAAMFVVFLVRIPIIWFTVAFMPFMFLGFVIGDKMGQFNTMKIFEHFVKAAFLPTVIAIPFAVGFMILTEFTQIKCTDIVIAKELCRNTGPLLNNINSLWGLLILLIAFIVIWMGFWMAISLDEIYVKATSGIKSFGEQIGGTAMKLPLSIPLPIGQDGQKISILGLDDKLRNINAQLSGGTPINEIGKAFGGGGTESQKMVDALQDGTSGTNKALVEILKQLKTTGTLNKTNAANKIRIDIADETSDLNKGLKSAGIADPTKVTPEDIIRKASVAGSDELRQLLEEMKNNP